MTENTESLFDYESPESAGIPSEAVVEFIKELDKDGFCMHGFMMVKAGKVISEGYYAPFTSQTPHRMYSIGKSFTSVAIGLLQEEGKLKIGDRICHYFSDKLPEEGVHPYIQKTTIRDMLCMATPHSLTTYKQTQEEDWVKTFFTVKPVRYPGTSFAYDTSATHVLSALVERLSGMSLLDYLRKKILEPLGCAENIKWLTCPRGICQGGSGLICTLRDVAKFAYTCMNRGRYGGVQLIPEDYIKEATSFQISTCLQNPTEEQQGYGYQFWRCRNNGFSMYGMGGQLAVCLPESDFMLVTQADNMANPNGVQGIYDALWHWILPYLSKKQNMPILNNEAARVKLNKMTASLRIKTEKGEAESPLIPKINGKNYYFNKNDLGISQCSLEIQPEERTGSFHFHNDSGYNKISFGLHHMEEQKFPVLNHTCISSAAWVSENILHLRTYVIEEDYASVNITMTFFHDTITLAMKKTGENFWYSFDGYASGELKLSN